MTAGVPFPPNPPEQIIEQLRDEADPFGWTVPLTSAEAAVRAADSWWRSRLESDETVEAAQVALRKAVGGYSEFGDRERAAAEDRRILRAVLAALLPVAEKPPACRAPHCFSEYGTPCGTCPAEKPETDT